MLVIVIKIVHVQTLYRVLDFLDFGRLSKLSKRANLDFLDQTPSTLCTITVR